MATKSYSLSVVRELTAGDVGKLRKAGIDSTRKLLAATARGAKAEHALATSAGISLTKLHDAVCRADLLQVTGLGPKTAQLFAAAGVASTQALARSRSEHLVEALARYVNAHPQLKCRLPSPTTVASLVARAQKLSKGVRS
jgi:predicted flap endonuclease-1-like 5' DNA nuclease